MNVHEVWEMGQLLYKIFTLYDVSYGMLLSCYSNLFRLQHITTLCLKKSHLWLAIIFADTVRLWQFLA